MNELNEILFEKRQTFSKDITILIIFPIYISSIFNKILSNVWKLSTIFGSVNRIMKIVG